MIPTGDQHPSRSAVANCTGPFVALADGHPATPFGAIADAPGRATSSRDRTKVRGVSS